MAEYWLDYSAAKLTGATIRNAGYTGVIRYIDSPRYQAAKHTSVSEYQSHIAAGLRVLLVMQTTTTASDGGFSVGQEHARRALDGAKLLGYTGPVFFTNDRTTVPNAAAWRAYLDGAASVLGLSRVGAYGFRNAMDLAVGHATYFWQAGRRSDVATHVHLWQDNNTQVKVGGVTCDRNLVLKNIGSLSSSGGFLMTLSDKEQRDLYDRVFGMLRQRYYAKNDKGETVEVSATTAGARAATVLDSLDGNYLVGLINAVARDVAALKAAQTAPVPVEIDYDRIITGVVAKLSGVQFIPQEKV